ncbi:MAG: hypothetical protein FJW31_08475 [Acidobacteria bacterium]|nr:hypothetical protein [Acidobacteriota bacterium]
MRTWLLWSTATVLAAAAAEDHGRAAVQAFFAPGGITDKRAVYTGEMLATLNKPTMGVYWGPAIRKEFRLLQVSEAAAVHAVRATAPDASTQEWYAFVRQSGGTLRLEAVRTLALTATLAGLVEALQSKPNRSAEEEWRYRNAQLVLSSDEKLKALLIQRQEALESLLPLIAGGKPKEEAVRSAIRGMHFSLARQPPPQAMRRL